LVSYNSQNDQFGGYEDFGIDDVFLEMDINHICDQALVNIIVKPWNKY